MSKVKIAEISTVIAIIFSVIITFISYSSSLNEFNGKTVNFVDSEHSFFLWGLIVINILIASFIFVFNRKTLGIKVFYAATMLINLYKIIEYFLILIQIKNGEILYI